MSRIEAQVAAMGLPSSVAVEVHAACARRGDALRAQLARVKTPVARERCIAAARALLDAEVKAAIAGPSMSVDDGWLS